jgi:hypothetical protein
VPGTPGVVVQPPVLCTINTASFDAALVPAAVRARTRTKYVPAGTLVAVSVGAVEPVSLLARSVRPLADPASTTYEVGASPVVGAVHESTTVLPETEAVSEPGAPGTTSGTEMPVGSGS